jgi:hypothetical protein
MPTLAPLSPRDRASIFLAEPTGASGDFARPDALALDFLGRQVGLTIVPRLTDRATRAQSYAVVLYGLSLAHEAADHHGLATTDDEIERGFARFERVWALACLESRRGEIAAGSPDAMRGLAGASRAWAAGDRELPRDFALVTRCRELGMLAANLEPMRLAGLILPDSLRPAPAASPILDAFWDEPDADGRSRALDQFLLDRLAPDARTIPRRSRGVSLGVIGERSRLSSLNGRRAQQDRLHSSIFEQARDPMTLPLTALVRRACTDGAAWISTEAFLEGAVGGRYGELEAVVAEHLELGLAFGRVAVALSERFAAVWRSAESGAANTTADVVRAAFPKEDLRALGRLCAELTRCARFETLRALPEHGADFAHCVESIVDAGPTVVYEAMMDLHAHVQRRRGQPTWLREDDDRLFVHERSSRGRPSVRELLVFFPSFAIPTLRQLLRDLGRLDS